jgi:nucleotide-binding universal stress UspA family protein
MFPIQTILHPTDFSTCSECAFGQACRLARDLGARLVVLHVAPPGQPRPALELTDVLPPDEDYRETLERRLQWLEPTCPDSSSNAGWSRATRSRRSSTRPGRPGAT